MQLLNERPTFSATDLNNFLACEHLTTLDLDVLREGLERPTQRSGQAELLSKLGEQHEAVYLEKLRAEGRGVVTIARADMAAAAAATQAAMASGASVIYQATFYDGTWLGHADFLRRIDVKLDGCAWDWHYEVEDTKLARHTEPYFLLQLCNYSEHVARIQGAMPERMYVVLGDGTRHEFRVHDFVAYYRCVKARFLRRLGEAVVSYPYPNKHCDLCVWDDSCAKRRRDDDHLSLVANITRLQTHRLTEGGVRTLAQLGAADSTLRPARLAEETFATLVRQARLQFEQRQALARNDPDPYRYELLPRSTDPDDPARGFGLLPKASSGDVFFDMEGDPYYEIGEGLEYLFGAHTHDDGAFHAFWGCDRTPLPGNDRLWEKRAFEAFIDFIMDRRERFPDMHIYHYASYEKTALCKLAQRHATREAEVDRILREEMLVDLYRVVRQAVAVGQPSYSIKKLEDYYGRRGDTAVKAGDESILQFEKWLATRVRPDTRDDGILRDLETYNRFDCESTYGLREWLLQLRAEAEAATGVEIAPFRGTPAAEVKADTSTHAELKKRLEACIPEDFDAAAGDRSDDGVRRAFMLRHMLEYHWREEKPLWWQFFDRCAAYTTDRTDLSDDADCIVGLEPAGEPQPVGRGSMEYSLRYPMQLHKVGLGEVYDLRTEKKAGEIVGITEFSDHGIMRLRRGPSLADVPVPQAITVCKIIRAGVVRDGIARFADSVLAGTARERFPAILDVVDAAAPRVADRPPGSVLQPAKTDEASIRAVVDALDRSYLFVQGPPGSGKTYIGARLIAELVRAGRKIGVMANSHKAIHNLLDAVCDVAQERGIAYTGVKKSSNGDAETEYDRGNFRSDDKTLVHDDADIVAGTAWAFATEKMAQRLDYLFIDEAGQVALPAAVGAMTAARNVIFLGDPLQLAQVSHTRHPGDIGVSVLEHLLHGELRPVRPDRGIFLTDSYRMHPAVCDFVSDVMYDGRLKAAPGRERQDVASRGLSGTGLRFLPVKHQFNRQRSIEEAQVIADQIDGLMTGTVTTVDGVRRDLVSGDVIVVTPYNAQVACIRRELDARGHTHIAVGTVDKFQGREAYVVFFSTAASSADEASRGVSFIFDRQRFNVAISRARALAVWVGSPHLVPQRCTSVEDVRVANGVCRFLELAN
ncbi:MAG: TM0106 family RecB-like putative nuclease [Candidatus Velthaea sp.]